MTFKEKFHDTKITFSRCKRSAEDIPVNNGLSVTPSQMMNLARQGVPISTQNEQNFYDGDTNPSWTINPEKLRNIDPADLWTISTTAKKKLRTAKRENKE